MQQAARKSKTWVVVVFFLIKLTFAVFLFVTPYLYLCVALPFFIWALFSSQGKIASDGEDGLSHVRWCSQIVIAQTVAIIYALQNTATRAAILQTEKSQIALHDDSRYISAMGDDAVVGLMIFIYIVASVIPLLWMFLLAVMRRREEVDMLLKRTQYHHFDYFTVWSARILFLTLLSLFIYTTTCAYARRIPGQVQELQPQTFEPYIFKTDHSNGIRLSAYLQIVEVTPGTTVIELQAHIPKVLVDNGWYIANIYCSNARENETKTVKPRLKDGRLKTTSTTGDFWLHDKNGIKTGEVFQVIFLLSPVIDEKTKKPKLECESQSDVIEGFENGVYFLNIAPPVQKPVDK